MNDQNRNDEFYAQQREDYQAVLRNANAHVTEFLKFANELSGASFTIDDDMVNTMAIYLTYTALLKIGAADFHAMISALSTECVMGMVLFQTPIAGIMKVQTTNTVRLIMDELAKRKPDLLIGITDESVTQVCLLAVLQLISTRTPQFPDGRRDPHMAIAFALKAMSEFNEAS